MESANLHKAVLLLALECECDHRILESLFYHWPPIPNQLVFWIYMKLIETGWEPTLHQKKDVFAFLTTPCHAINFDCLFRKDKQAFLVSAQFMERTDLWILRMSSITGVAVIKATWQVTKGKWLLGYNDHSEYGFKTLATEWLK
jgi:hypothetical protein